MLMPNNPRRRTSFRGRMTGKALRGNKITNGEFAIVACEPAWVRSNQIEAARVAMTRYMKRDGKVWIKIFPDKPISSRGIGVRMGKGKGGLDYWAAVVKPGRVMFECGGVSEEVAREAMRLAINKLPLKCKFVTKAMQEEEEKSEN
ncbi:MAG: 50S ribosomal protein L16 [Clostridia bacterium]|nr:50S ribosomal protein L16 [Clostridia bacterium]